MIGLKTIDGIADIAGNYASKGVGERGAWFRDSEGPQRPRPSRHLVIGRSNWLQGLRCKASHDRSLLAGRSGYTTYIPREMRR